MENIDAQMVLERAYYMQWSRYEVKIKRLEGAVRGRDERIKRLLDEVQKYKDILREEKP